LSGDDPAGLARRKPLAGRRRKVHGDEQTVRKTSLRQGRKKLGSSTAAVEARITALSDLDYLNGLLDRILDVSTWDELLGP
jgi:hypothetical protein